MANVWAPVIIIFFCINIYIFNLGRLQPTDHSSSVMKRAPPKKCQTTTSTQHALNAGSCLSQLAIQTMRLRQSHSSFAPSQNPARRVYGCFEVFPKMFFKLF